MARPSSAFFVFQAKWRVAPFWCESVADVRLCSPVLPRADTVNLLYRAVYRWETLYVSRPTTSTLGGWCCLSYVYDASTHVLSHGTDELGRSPWR